MLTWAGDAPPPRVRIGPLALGRALVRGAALAAVVYGGLALFFLLRLIEWPFGRRPLSPFVTQGVCRAAFPILGIRWRVEGAPLDRRGAIVANHVSWLDIFSLNAAQRVFFVAKAEVARWPGIGILARATGTLFINRRRAEAGRQRSAFAERLALGDRLLFFPEATSSDGRRVLPFKSTPFAAFFDDPEAHALAIQPVTLVYRAPPGQDPRFFGWWGEMAFGPHLLQVLAHGAGGEVTVIQHPPVRVADFADRKALARHLEGVIGAALAERIGTGA